MRISDWSSDVCSSDLQRERRVAAETAQIDRRAAADIDAIRPRDIEADAGLLTPTEALRDRAYDFAERRLARIADIVLTEHDDRRRHRRAADARSGNDDVVVWDMIGSILRCFRVRFDDKTAGDEIGRAPCWERVGQYVKIAGVAGER